MDRFGLILIFLLSFLSLEGKQLPEPTGRLVSDYIGLLSTAENQQLENKLVAYNDSSSTQIAIVIENSLEGEDIFDYSYRLAQSWGIGQKENSNGILLYIAYGDRKLRIQTGSGTEGFLTDGISKRIIENIIVPAFRNSAYYEGLDKATSTIMQLGSGEYSALDIGKNRSKEDQKAIYIVVLLFIIISLIIIKGIWECKKKGNCGDSNSGGYHKKGRYHSGGFWGVSSGGSWSSGGSSGFGGGGFGGFGGGGFSGGGAGGSW